MRVWGPLRGHVGNGETRSQVRVPGVVGDALMKEHEEGRATLRAEMTMTEVPLGQEGRKAVEDPEESDH